MALTTTFNNQTITSNLSEQDVKGASNIRGLFATNNAGVFWHLVGTFDNPLCVTVLNSHSVPHYRLFQTDAELKNLAPRELSAILRGASKIWRPVRVQLSAQTSFGFIVDLAAQPYLGAPLDHCRIAQVQVVYNADLRINLRPENSADADRYDITVNYGRRKDQDTAARQTSFQITEYQEGKRRQITEVRSDHHGVDGVDPDKQFCLAVEF